MIESLLILLGTLAAGAGVIAPLQPAAKQAEPSAAARTSEPAHGDPDGAPLPHGASPARHDAMAG